MSDYVKVGFNEHEGFASKDTEEEDMIASIPKQVHQYFSIVPTQYRLIYLLAFLYAHQKEKIIIFVGNCELANFIAAIIQKFDWSKCGRRKEDIKITDTKTEEKTDKKQE